MKRCERIVAGLLALTLAIPLPLLAQQPVSPVPFKPEELEQIAAPIALYPDPLLAQVLMASTYPLEVVQAARFVQANPSLRGDALTEAVMAQSWDDSVKSLVVFPQVLTMMSEKLDWTQKLGDAFLSQGPELMDAIQRLRARAQAQGTLTTTPQQTVTVEAAPPPPTLPPGEPGPPPSIIQIEPASPDVIYVPTYDPMVVYGPWPYPAYPPYYYYPPGWIVPGAFFSFGVGIFFGIALWGACDWHHHTVYVDSAKYHHFTRIVNSEGRRGELERRRRTEFQDRDRFTWEHDPQHRKGVDYRNEATQQRFGRARPANPQAREAFRGRAELGRQELGKGAAEQFRPGQRAVPTPPGVGLVQPGGAGRLESARPTWPALRQGREPGAFQGLGSGGDMRSYSSRGRESRQSITRPSPGIRTAPPAIRSAPPAIRSAPPVTRGAPARPAPGGGVRGGAAPGGVRR